MLDRIEKVKKHLKENRVTYYVGATCLVVGAAVGLSLNSKALIHIRPIQVMTWKSKQTIEVFIEALGDPGNIIQDITTGSVYASQGQAARELGVSPARISEHLSGKLPNVKGHVFKFLAKAPVSDPAIA
jgi:hypothetical protein